MRPTKRKNKRKAGKPKACSEAAVQSELRCNPSNACSEAAIQSEENNETQSEETDETDEEKEKERE
jgi:hypothetical protein